jgi:hypothetical protein
MLIQNHSAFEIPDVNQSEESLQQTGASFGLMLVKMAVPMNKPPKRKPVA